MLPQNLTAAWAQGITTAVDIDSTPGVATSQLWGKYTEATLEPAALQTPEAKPENPLVALPGTFCR